MLGFENQQQNAIEQIGAYLYSVEMVQQMMVQRNQRE